MRSELSLDLPSPSTVPLETRMAEFKSDPKKMDDVNEFVDDVLKAAEGEINKKNEITMEPVPHKRNEILDGVKDGKFVEDKELKCYVLCLAQMLGLMSKKGDVNLQKALQQMDVLLPVELKEPGKAAFNSCKEVCNLGFSGLKRGRIVTRARGFVLRLFEAICNCTNSGTVPTAQRPTTPTL